MSTPGLKRAGWRELRKAQVGAKAGLAAVLAASCVFTPPPPLPEELAEIEAAERARAEALGGGQPFDPEAPEGGGGQATFGKGEPPPPGLSPEQIKAYAISQGDPEAGEFTLAEALAGVPDGGTLFAVFHTNAGDMSCELYETLVPGTVANFVGLARGKRPTYDAATDAWEAQRFYDGVAFHRVIPGFMIQGGDPTGTGRGETGYVIEDELLDELRHDKPGILSMANRGPGTGSGQFFITLAPTPHLDGKHAVFGACDEAAIDVAEHIAAKRGAGDRPTDPQVIESVEIVRR